MLEQHDMIKPEGARAAKMKCYGAKTGDCYQWCIILSGRCCATMAAVRSAPSTCPLVTNARAQPRLSRLTGWRSTAIVLRHSTWLWNVRLMAPFAQSLSSTCSRNFARCPFLGVPHVLGHIGMKSSVACWSAQPVVGRDRGHEAPPATLCSGSSLLALRCPICVEGLGAAI